MVTYETLLFEIKNNVATITLNRPDAGNALNKRMSYEMFMVSQECASNPEIRAVIWTANGKLFCGGGDLKELNAQEDKAQHFREMTAYIHVAISRFARMNAPLIGAINGTAGGAGMSFVCGCDLAIAVDTAKFTMAYTNAGLVPDGSSTYFLPRIVGARRAMELALTNRVLTAQEALDWGIINKVVTADELMNEANALAEKLATGPTLAYGGTKKLLQFSFNQTLETQMEDESQAIVQMTRTRDGQEGVSAFAEKRKPIYTGQ
jgi:2-(1,2-epoxy-1,2-dihydrophenyl)acetyl-CoA isomerase